MPPLYFVDNTDIKIEAYCEILNAFHLIKLRVIQLFIQKTYFMHVHIFKNILRKFSVDPVKSIGDNVIGFQNFKRVFLEMLFTECVKNICISEAGATRNFYTSFCEVITERIKFWIISIFIYLEVSKFRKNDFFLRRVILSKIRILTSPSIITCIYLL